MFKQTITRVKPNQTVKWHFDLTTEEATATRTAVEAIQLAAGVNADTDANYSITQTLSDDELTLTVVRTSSTRVWLDQLEAALKNPDHSIYARTRYYADNGVTETYATEEITA